MSPSPDMSGFRAALLNVSPRVTPTCPACHKVIPSEDINVATDVAFCRSCDASYKLSDLASGLVLDETVDLEHPPAGAWYRSQGPISTVGVSHRSGGTAFGSLILFLFWNGIVGFFVLLAISATLYNLGLEIPEWLPPAVSKGQPVGVGLNIFLWVFLTPFIAIGLGLLAALLMSIGGKTEVRTDGNQGSVVSGIGPLRRTKRFDVSNVSRVRLERRQRLQSSKSQPTTWVVIDLHSGKPIRFGSALPDGRRMYLASAAAKILKR